MSEELRQSRGGVRTRHIDPAPTPSESTPGQRQPATRARDVESGRFAQVAESQSLFSRSGCSKAIRKLATQVTPG